MTIDKEKILHIINNDLTGYKLEIVRHTDSNLIGITGHILNETKSSLLIASPKIDNPSLPKSSKFDKTSTKASVSFFICFK